MTQTPLHTASTADLDGGRARVVVVRTLASLHSADELLGTLPPAEQQHARRLHGTARDRFIITRAALRSVLGSRTGTAPAELELVREPSGKLITSAAHRIHFSLTHSADLALIALSRSPIGVDVEHLRPLRRWQRTAARVLHARTVALLMAQPEDQRVASFLDAWTQREAHVKAVGGGLFRTPDTLPFEPREPADNAVVFVREHDTAAEWSVFRFAPVPRARAAVVVRGAVPDIAVSWWTSQRGEHE